MTKWIHAVLFVLISPLLAVTQDFNKPIEGRVQLGVHEFNLEPDSAYIFRLRSKEPNLQISIDNSDIFNDSTHRIDSVAGKMATFESHGSPVRTCDVKVRIVPSTFRLIDCCAANVAAEIQADTGFLLQRRIVRAISRAAVNNAGPYDYVLTAERHKLEPIPILDIKGMLTFVPDEKKAMSKAYTVNFKKGRIYVIEMNVRGEGGVTVNFGSERGTGEFFSTPRQSATIPVRRVVRAIDDGEYWVAGGLGGEPAMPIPFNLKVFQSAKE